MPFKSEKQRRYLWANEPEIARDWTNRYGAANGGIMHQFENYAHDDGNNVSVPRSFQARPHSDQVNLAYITPQEQGILQALKPDTPHEGPMGIPNYDSFDAAGNYTSGATMSGMETGAKNERSRADRRAAGISPQEAQDIRSSAINAGAGQVVNRGWFGPKYNQTVGVGDIAAAKAFRNNPNNRFAKQAYRNTRGSNFGIGNLLRGAMSIFGGVPGSMMSMLSHINPGKLRGWNEQYGRYNTQDEYEQARTNRRNTKRMDYLSDRKSRGLGYGKKAYGDLLGQGYSDPFQEALNRDLQINPETTQFSRSHLQSLANKQALTNQLSAKDFINLDPSNMRMMEVANNPALSRYKKTQGIASINNQWSKPQFQQAGYVPKYVEPSGQYSDSIAKLGYKKAIEEGVGPKEFDYADTLLNELQISDWDKIYPSENLDVKGIDTEAKQRSALNTLFGDVKTKKEALKGTDKDWMSNPTDDFEKGMAVDEFTSDYSENEDRLNDLGITTQEQYEDFINKAMRLKGYI